jgi:hypothetical protein
MALQENHQRSVVYVTLRLYRERFEIDAEVESWEKDGVDVLCETMKGVQRELGRSLARELNQGEFLPG